MKFFTSQSNKQTETENAICSATCAQLSAYVDNTLSARNVWDVEKHLAACPDCAEVSRQMQATVQLLHTVERLETGDDFMAKLHARLDGLEPEPARRTSLTDWMRDASANLRASLVSRRAPGFGLGMAVAGVAALAILTRLPAPVGQDTRPAIATVAPAVSAANIEVHGSLQRNVALTANDPLGDVAAAYLESAAGGKESPAKDLNNTEVDSRDANGS